MTSSIKQTTVILLILPLIFAAVQSAALRRHKRQNCDSTSLGAMIKQFYCTSDSLRRLSKSMVNENKTVALPAESIADADNQENINTMLQHFNFTCATFTTVMAIKHQLQYSLFNGTYYLEDSNGTLTEVTSDRGIRDLLTNLEYLEKIASILQNIEEYITSKQCIVFSSNQYKTLYWNFIIGNNISVLYTLQSMTWSRVNTYPQDTWLDEGRCAPPAQSSCNYSS